MWYKSVIFCYLYIYILTFLFSNNSGLKASGYAIIPEKNEEISHVIKPLEIWEHHKNNWFIKQLCYCCGSDVTLLVLLRNTEMIFELSESVVMKILA